MARAIGRRGALALAAANFASITGVSSVLRFVTSSDFRAPEVVVPPNRLPPPGTGAIVGDGRDEGRRVAVSDLGGGRYVAFVPLCTSGRCRLLWKESPSATPQPSSYYECYCDLSRFSIDGCRFDGPASRNLDRYESALNDRGALVVQTAVVIRGAIGEGVVPA